MTARVASITARARSTGQPTGRRVVGVAGAPGVAIGPAWRYPPVTVSRPAVGGNEDPAPTDLATAARQAARQLNDLAAGLRTRGAINEAAILEAQAMMAEDPSLLDEAHRRIAAGADVAEALTAAARLMAATLSRLDDPLLAARAADVLDVGDRIVRILRGVAVAPPTVPSIALGDDLPPSVAAELPSGLLLGIALQGGTPVAHAAILARALGIPAVVAAPGLLAALDDTSGPPDGADAAQAAVVVAIDGRTGEIVIGPDADEQAAFEGRISAEQRRRDRTAGQPARRLATADGSPVRLVANIGSPRDIQRALDAGAEGVGLLRTEFLFMERSRPPDEDEQTAAYREILAAFGAERPVVIRLADIGGDKPLPWLDLPAEANPFLGVRAIRLAYRTPDLLVTQLRAISRAGAEAGVTPHVMAPMIADAADVRLFQDLVEQAQAGLSAAGRPRSDAFVRGIMIEIPSAAILAAELAPTVDFFSIGTNDLTQYLFAADRTNAALGRFHDACQPAVLRSIAGIVAGARAARIPVAVCGELAADPVGALVLVGLGVDELSADPNAFDDIRTALAGSTMDELRGLATAALHANDAAAVRRLAAPLVARGLDA